MYRKQIQYCTQNQINDNILMSTNTRLYKPLKHHTRILLKIKHHLIEFYSVYYIKKQTIISIL